jgi:hypothetical protein
MMIFTKINREFTDFFPLILQKFMRHNVWFYSIKRRIERERIKNEEELKSDMSYLLVSVYIYASFNFFFTFYDFKNANFLFFSKKI